MGRFLSACRQFVTTLFSQPPPAPEESNDGSTGRVEIAVQESEPLLDSVEIFSMPGHGRTSFLWSMLFMLRQLSRVWPRYLCWPLDEETGKTLLRIHEELRLGRLPEPWSIPEIVRGEGAGEENGHKESSGAQSPRHALHLRNMNPWGDRHFVISDRPDIVFNSERLNGSGSERPKVRWNVPALWLLSLSNLKDPDGRFLDLKLDDLIRIRHGSGEAAREHPFRLVVVLTKGDAIPDLPQELRCMLQEDPLAIALAADTDGLFRGRDEIDVSPPPTLEENDLYPEYPTGDPLNAYFESRKIIHELVRDWMLSNSSGRSLVRRAEEFDIDLKFSLVSATGSGIIGGESGKQLATAWSPRRVLDPYFWALEMGLWSHT